MTSNNCDIKQKIDLGVAGLAPVNRLLQKFSVKMHCMMEIQPLLDQCPKDCAEYITCHDRIQNVVNQYSR